MFKLTDNLSTVFAMPDHEQDKKDDGGEEEKVSS